MLFFFLCHKYCNLQHDNFFFLVCFFFFFFFFFFFVVFFFNNYILEADQLNLNSSKIILPDLEIMLNNL